MNATPQRTEAIGRNNWYESANARPPQASEQQLARIEVTLIRIEKLLDEFCGVFLNTRFCGKGNNRWSRR